MKNKGLLVILSIFAVLLVISIPYIFKALNLSSFVTDDSSTRPLFSIRMVDFQSPVKLGNFLKFSYLIRDVSNTNDTAKLNFWLEKEGKVVSLGLDTIYLGNLEEKVRTGSIFLPSTMESGAYNFKIRLDYGGYSAESYRTIEIVVTRGVATIGSVGAKNPNIYIILGLILLVIVNIMVLYLLEKKNGNNLLEKIKNLFKKKPKIKNSKDNFSKSKNKKNPVSYAIDKA